MNLDVDCREKVVALTPGIVPLLALTSEWAKFGEDAFYRTDLILLLLQSIQAVSAKSGEGPTLNSLRNSLLKISGQTFLNNFLKCLKEASTDLSSFMSLFDYLGDLLVPQITDGEEPPQLLDVNCRNSIFGTFVRSCVLEYRCLTFSQLARFHNRFNELVSDEKNWDNPLGEKEVEDKMETHIKRREFLAALKCLAFSHHRGGERGVAPSEHEMGSEALFLASLHGQLGHHKEGLLALQEAVQLAQQGGKNVLLEHTLAWLHKLKPFDGDEATAILDRFIKNAEELKLPLLGMWGKLQQVKSQLSQSKEPHQVLQTLMSSESDFSTVYEDKLEKATGKASLLAMQASVCEHFGQRLLAVLYSQMLCHMTSCDPLSQNSEQQEAVALCVGLLAKHMAQTGSFDQSQCLFREAKRHLTDSTLPYKVLCKCSEEVDFERAVLTGEFGVAVQHLRNIETLDKWKGRYLSAQLLQAKGSHQHALTSTQSLVQDLKRLENPSPELVKLLSHSLLLLAEVHSDIGSPCSALIHALDSLSLCKTSHLPSQPTELCLAQIQLQLKSPSHSLSLIRNCLFHCLSNGPCLDRGRAYFIMAQATLCCKGERASDLTKEDILATIPMVTQAVGEFRKLSANQLLREIFVLQAHLYNSIGYISERDKVIGLLAK